MANDFPDVKVISELCLKKFKTLPKTGKPIASEWTVLAGVVLQEASKAKVVALGCGTKCVGQGKLCRNGLILNDSHAEVLARRALLRYLFQELKKATSGKTEHTIFEWNQQELRFDLKDAISFHFFSTQTPCGDACITENVADNESETESIPEKRRKFSQVEEDLECSLLDANATVYTGAKLIGQEHGDAMEQTLGSLRTKPGKGDRTLSMSCSDKLSKWNVLGVQGSLLHMLIEKPIYLKTLNFSCDTSKVAVERAVYRRWFDRKFVNPYFEPQEPEIRISKDVRFEFEQRPNKNPSPNGLAWCDVEEKLKPYEVSVNGKRQGVTAKKLNTSHAALKISRHHLLKDFVHLLSCRPELLTKYNLNATELNTINYDVFKKLAETYQKAWKMVKRDYFRQWTTKPSELSQFSLDSVS